MVDLADFEGLFTQAAKVEDLFRGAPTALNSACSSAIISSRLSLCTMKFSLGSLE